MRRIAIRSRSSRAVSPAPSRRCSGSRMRRFRMTAQKRRRSSRSPRPRAASSRCRSQRSGRRPCGPPSASAAARWTTDLSRPSRRTCQRRTRTAWRGSSRCCARCCSFSRPSGCLRWSSRGWRMARGSRLRCAPCSPRSRTSGRRLCAGRLPRPSPCAGRSSCSRRCRTRWVRSCWACRRGRRCRPCWPSTSTSCSSGRESSSPSSPRRPSVCGVATRPGVLVARRREKHFFSSSSFSVNHVRRAPHRAHPRATADSSEGQTLRADGQISRKRSIHSQSVSPMTL
mmetsp:Transcript_31512/g.100460  ORF Transcript_31512/g.100460 Transcript_31512/m.100460 type:complete len:285 (+) Transcript_31512:272-1126(+)